ncbi:hypothetical protein KIMC2_20800 [Xylocopilactobacillus apis]|uniref:IrrE N-terminal-like domain-containing protein n=1 Tax=Xylocopilactobacillus apis TaxID=2932183 RepID=A0AAU9DQW4_9LACO|nr:hypothetical protein KIMC2_20800 [Xylocopilactobacillus apis]
MVQYRTSVKEVESKNIINSNAWVQTALNIAVQKNVSSIDLDYLKTKLPDIRKMTKQNPEVFLPELNRIFENSGVAFVILPNLKNCGINGAVKWIGKDRILLAVNDRSKYADQFWFTLFHEIKHVFQRKKGHMIVTPIGDNGITNNLDLDRLEKEADQFAQNHLINPADYKAFIKENDFSRRAVLEFSEGIQIHPGVVVGRLQREKYLDYRHLNDLKIQYHFD